MAEDKPKRDPVELFIRRMRATLKSLEVLERPELLGQFEAIHPEFQEMKAAVATIHSYNKQYLKSIAELDAQIAANKTTAEPLLTKKERLQSEAATYYQREANRLARGLKNLAELTMAEYGIQYDKIDGAIVSPEEETLARAELREGLAATDEFTKHEKTPKTDTDKAIQKWSDYIFEYEDRTYQMFLPESSVLFRMNDVPQELRPTLTLLSAIDFFETVSEHSMAMATAMRDTKRLGKPSL